MTSNEARSRKLADELRAHHDLGDAPIKDLFEFIHAAAGVDVLSMAAAESDRSQHPNVSTRFRASADILSGGSDNGRVAW